MIGSNIPQPAAAGVGGSTGSVDNAILRADGTGGSTLQNSGLVVEDTIVSFTSITGVASTDIITATGSAFANGQPIRFTALTGGTGLNTTTNYFVINVAGATFQVSTSLGGGASLFTTNITAGTLLTGHSVQVNVTLSENTTETNSALVLTPKGTGALIAGPKPDGAATGGNARGSKAICLVGDRSAATQVASGANSVAIGYRATASGTQNIAISGTASGASNSIAIGGSAGFYATSVGGNASATGAIAIGSDSNGATASGTNSICIGRDGSNAASQTRAILIGGANSSSTGTGSILVGWSQAISGDESAIIGGTGNGATASGCGIVSGFSALANRRGMQAHAGGQFAAQGDAQRARFVLRCKTTTNAAVEMALDGSTTYLTIPSGKVMFMNIKVVGSKSDGSAVATYERQYAVKNVAGTSSEVYAPITIGTDNAAGTTIEVATVDAGDYVRIRPTGITSEIWRWVASVDAVEVAYGT